MYAGHKHEYTYDASGNETLHISYEWDRLTNKWILNGKGEITYDANGNEILLVEYDWNETSSQWVFHTKVERAYDANGNWVLYFYYGWDLTTSQWVLYTKSENIYDANGNKNLNISYSGYFWDKTSSQFIPYYKYIAYYSEHNFIRKIPETNIYVYPNPASEYLLFHSPYISESAIVEIFDMSGKKVMEKDISDDMQISVNQLAHGIYLYRLNYSGTIYRGKVIVDNKIKY
jgi:hypothetical protein